MINLKFYDGKNSQPRLALALISVNNMGGIDTMENHDSLRKLIEVALKEKGLTLHRLAKKFGIGYSTLRRFMQGEGEPSYSTITAIVFGLLHPSEAAKFFLENYPDMPITKSSAFYARKGFDSTPQEFEPKFLTRDEFLAFIITQSKNRVNRSKLKSFIGHKADKAIDKLLDDEVIRESGDDLYSLASDVILNEHSTNLANIKHTIDEFDVDSLDVPGNLYGLRFQGLNDAGLHEMHKLCFEFLDRADQILFNSAFRGEKVLVCGLVQTILEGDFK